MKIDYIMLPEYKINFILFLIRPLWLLEKLALNAFLLKFLYYIYIQVAQLPAAVLLAYM